MTTKTVLFYTICAKRNNSLQGVQGQLTFGHSNLISWARMSNIPALRGDATTGKYPPPSQIRGILLSDCIKTGRVAPHSIHPYLLPVNIRREIYLGAK
jgi:hypothetical protein